MPPADRARSVVENDDLCALKSADGAKRFFLRGLITVPLRDAFPRQDVHWGIWAEIARADFDDVVWRWKQKRQSLHPLFKGTLANRVPRFPDTIGLRVEVQLTGPKTRPDFFFLDGQQHPFIEECRRGVTTHRAAEWLQK